MVKSRTACVAVVGASSQIGQALLPRLASAGYSAYQIGREGKGIAGRTTTYVFNELSCSFVPALESADAVISLAPLPSIDVALKMAQALGAKRVIAFGSTGRFSKISSTSAIEKDFVAQQERAEGVFTKGAESAGIRWTLFRPTMVYGADSDLNVSFIKLMIKKFGFFPIPVGAHGLRQPVHVDDLAAACVLALVHEVTCNKAYNLGGGEILSFPDLVKRIFKTAGKRPILIPMPLLFFSILIKIAKKFPSAAFVRKEMVERMFHDLVTDNRAAINDFGYEPRSFDSTTEI